MPKKTKLENRPKWFSLNKYKSELSIDIWLNELMVRWELLNKGINPYGYEYVWEAIKKNGYYIPSNNPIFISLNDDKSFKVHPIKLSEQSKKRIFGLENSHISSLRFYELCLLAQALVDDIEKLDLSKPGIIKSKEQEHYPDLNLLVNDMISISSEKTDYRFQNIVHLKDRSNQNQFLSVDLNATDEDLVNQFKVWLSFARKSYYNPPPEISGNRSGKLEKAMNLKSLNDLQKLKEQSDNYKVIPYLDLKIHIMIENLRSTQEKLASDIGVDIHSFKKYTLALSKDLTNKNVLSHLCKLTR